MQMCEMIFIFSKGWMRFRLGKNLRNKSLSLPIFYLIEKWRINLFSLFPVQVLDFFCVWFNVWRMRIQFAWAESNFFNSLTRRQTNTSFSLSLYKNGARFSSSCATLLLHSLQWQNLTTLVQVDSELHDNLLLTDDVNIESSCLPATNKLVATTTTTTFDTTE